jgi:LytS/YehU family sensor histidine kinase
MNKVKNIFLDNFIETVVWSLFYILILFQTKPTNAKEYLSWLLVVIVSAVFSHINIAVSFDILLQKRQKWLNYALIFLNTVAGAASLLVVVPISLSRPWYGYFIENIINVLLFSSVIGGIKFYKDSNQKRMQIVELENKQLTIELSVLKAQIHPHFLFNTLNNLYGLITYESKEKAAAHVLKLSALMRYILENGQKDKVGLTQEIEFMKNYIDLESIRLPLSVQVNVDMSVADSTLEIPPLLLIPLVENVFKHGIQNYSHEGFAHFTLAIQGKDLFFEVENSSTPPPQYKPQNSGLGLQNLKNRLDILFPNRFLLNIHPTTHTFKTSLNIEL